MPIEKPNRSICGSSAEAVVLTIDVGSTCCSMVDAGERIGLREARAAIPPLILEGHAEESVGRQAAEAVIPFQAELDFANEHRVVDRRVGAVDRGGPAVKFGSFACTAAKVSADVCVGPHSVDQRAL